ncbi:MAG: ABC transporter permease subunit [Treponema sp.]|nr:ABC transporter permease subunit [Treponema sp.]
MIFFKTDFRKNKYLYLMLLPVVVYFGLFHYQPMLGLQIAFKDYSFRKGIWASPWVGFSHFIDFFKSYYFVRLLRNTLFISLSDLIWGFPAPIILALLINELRWNFFKRAVQSITYLPHFISLVVVAGMIKDFFGLNGLANTFVSTLGLEKINFFLEGEYFVPIYIGSNIWQHIGWGTIIYLAALSSIDPQLYEAARIDGAGKIRQIIHITIPGILSTIVILLILRTGRALNVGSEKILLLYNPAIYENADVISTFVYRKGLEEANYSYATAVGFFNSVVNFIIISLTNAFSRKVSETSLW